MKTKKILCGLVLSSSVLIVGIANATNTYLKDSHTFHLSGYDKIHMSEDNLDLAKTYSLYCHPPKNPRYVGSINVEVASKANSQGSGIETHFSHLIPRTIASTNGSIRYTMVLTEPMNNQGAKNNVDVACEFDEENI